MRPPIRQTLAILASLFFCLFTMSARPALGQWERESRRARRLHRQGRLTEALAASKTSLSLVTKKLGPKHLKVALVMNNLAAVHRAMGHHAAAEPLYRNALAIEEKSLGAEHAGLAATLNNLAALLRAMGKYDEAIPVYERALAIDKKSRGPRHPEVATDLNNLAQVYRSQKKYDKATELFTAAIKIWEGRGKNHPDLAYGLNNLAATHDGAGQYATAMPLYERSRRIFARALGPRHRNVRAVSRNIERLRRKMAKATDQAKEVKALPPSPTKAPAPRLHMGR